MTHLDITVIDWAQSETNPRKVTEQLEYAFRTTGFCLLQNHGINLAKLSHAEASFKTFFTEITEATRMQYAYPDKNYQIGYTPLRKEKGEGAKIADEKHFYHVYPSDSPYVNELPDFKENTDALWHEFNTLARSVMRIIAISMNEFHDFFETAGVNDGYSIVRGIHYPAGPRGASDGSVVIEGGNVGDCAAPHTDINAITLLTAKEKGLQLWHNGEWREITLSDPNMIILNCGDQLQHMTNGCYVSGKHRVVCEEWKERFSIPYFHHVPGDFIITPREQFGEAKPQFHFTTSYEYLMHRLRELGLAT